MNEIALGIQPKEELTISKNSFSHLNKQGISNAKVSSSINLLETADYLKQISQFEKKHYFKFLLNDTQVRDYLKNLVNRILKDFIFSLVKKYRAKGFVSKVPIDFYEISDLTGLTNSEILQQLNTLSNIGIIEYDKPSVEVSVKLLQPRLLAENLSLDFKGIDLKINNAKQKLTEMINFCYSQNCRFDYVLNYFGEKLDDYKCGKCDNCTNKFDTVKFNEFIEDKVLTTLHIANFVVYKNLLYKILLGTDKTGKYSSFSTYGSCEHYKKSEIDNSISRLHSINYVGIIDNNYHLTEKGKGQFLLEEEDLAKNNDNETDSLQLFNKLRNVRRYASRRFSQPVQYICPDNTLRMISDSKPKSSEEFLAIEGVNRRMFNKIGEDFLEIIQSFNENKKVNPTSKKNNIPDTILKTYELIKRNYSLHDIVKMTKLPESVVSLQIESIVNYYPDANIKPLFEKKEFEEIINIVEIEGTESLKVLKDKLPAQISYAKIRIVVAKVKNESDKN